MKTSQGNKTDADKRVKKVGPISFTVLEAK